MPLDQGVPEMLISGTPWSISGTPCSEGITQRKAPGRKKLFSHFSHIPWVSHKRSEQNR
jgi:hypothetical protein